VFRRDGHSPDEDIAAKGRAYLASGIENANNYARKINNQPKPRMKGNELAEERHHASTCSGFRRCSGRSVVAGSVNLYHFRVTPAYFACCFIAKFDHPIFACNSPHFRRFCGQPNRSNARRYGADSLSMNKVGSAVA
jgi:hypothetical protein